CGVLLLRGRGFLRRRLGLERRVLLARNAHAHRRRDRARLRIEQHRKNDHREQYQRDGTDQPPAAATFERIYVLLLFSHAMTSATVRNEPNTMILSPSLAAAFAAANACAGESNRYASPETLAARSAAAAPRGPGSEARCQRVTRGASSRSTAPMSLSPSMPHTAIVCAANPASARLCASTFAACALCATSRITCGRPGRTWKRPAISTSARPRRTSCIAIGSSSVPSAQIAAAALASWILPRSAGWARPLRRPPGPQ